jgi:hypothetical protein
MVLATELMKLLNIEILTGSIRIARVLEWYRCGRIYTETMGNTYQQG